MTWRSTTTLENFYDNATFFSVNSRFPFVNFVTDKTVAIPVTIAVTVETGHALSLSSRRVDFTKVLVWGGRCSEKGMSVQTKTQKKDLFPEGKRSFFIFRKSSILFLLTGRSRQQKRR
jgi:hypothetical protein